MSSTERSEAKQIIATLNVGKFYCLCPCGCGEEIRLSDADLFYLNDFSKRGKEAFESMKKELLEQKQELKERAASMKKKTSVTAKAVNIGFILERIAPAFDRFPFNHKDCRSMFDPIDYVIFEGMSKKGTVDKIIFTDIKTGSARLNQHQKEVKSLIEKKKIEYRRF